MGDKTNKLNVYLIKPEFNRLAQIVDESARSHEIDSVGTLYTEASHPRAPDWIQAFFVDTFPLLIVSSRQARRLSCWSGFAKRVHPTSSQSLSVMDGLFCRTT